MSLVFAIPGKTFVAGEYSVLQGGAALIAATTPEFKVWIEKGQGELANIHADSPAGKFHQKHFDFFKKFSVRFEDELKVGGLGASTAPFLALYAFNEWRESCELETEKYLDHREMIKAYLECAWNGQGAPPSGVDLLGQERGHLMIFDKNAGRMSVHSWPFPHLKFYLVHTGIKLATHEHLKTLADFDTTAMKTAFASIQKALGGAESSIESRSLEEREAFFVEGIQAYAKALLAQNLTAAHSIEFLNDIRQLPEVVAAKGCGAMGSDVLFIVTRKTPATNERPSDADSLSTYLHKKNLQILATEKSLSEGLQMRVVQGDLF